MPACAARDASEDAHGPLGVRSDSSAPSLAASRSCSPPVLLSAGGGTAAPSPTLTGEAPSLPPSLSDDGPCCSESASVPGGSMGSMGDGSVASSAASCVYDSPIGCSVVIIPPLPRFRLCGRPGTCTRGRWRGGSLAPCGRGRGPSRLPRASRTRDMSGALLACPVPPPCCVSSLTLGRGGTPPPLSATAAAALPPVGARSLPGPNDPDLDVGVSTPSRMRPLVSSATPEKHIRQPITKTAIASAGSS
mmetsp:Transcript_20564/g.53140  ORF Transcript_20564/g.53140 Transcript_20564/m.53140 type:complete len:248 (+) Transcript_20564:722-1465(+)